MLWLEIVAAALVGVALIVLVVAPLVERSAADPAVDEPEDLEETPHGIALAALKEIEFDRATGKLSDDDYAALKQKYTGEALAALRAADGPLGDAADTGPDIEVAIAARAEALRHSAARSGASCPVCGPRPEADALYCSSCGSRLAVVLPRAS